MNRASSDCGCKQTGTREKSCLCCDIPAFCRNHYYRGKLLTERDFSDEQRYHIDKMRQHTLRLHGWGVVCGLTVVPHQHCPERRMVLQSGYAIDDCGREIRLLEDDYLELPQPPKPAPASDHDSEMDAKPAQDHEANKPRQQGDEEDYPLPSNPCDDTVMPKDLYICIRYAECETEFAPAPFDDCSCNDAGQQPNRVCEGYKLELYDSKPSFWDKATHEDCGYEDCGEYYREARKHCHHEHRIPCIPLAVIYNVVPGEAVKPEQINNWEPRRQLTSTDTLDQIVRCILTKLPTKQLTRVEDTNWEHNRRMLCREFTEEYIGTAEHPRGFRIQFSHRVHPASIDTRSFQAIVVFRPENMADPKVIQVAPAHIDTDHDETTWCRLRIDPAYARRHLEGKNFDLFIVLRCDVITDVHGHAVDGNYIGHRLPTGDNIQGGTFESWIRVRPRPRNG